MNKPTVTVAIPAYNSSKNIKNLLNSLLSMETSLVKKYSILVHIDLGSDNTAEVVKKVKSKRIKVITATTRKGFAGSVQSIFKENTSNVLVIINDDIVIKDNKLVTKIIKLVKSDRKIMLASGNPIPQEPESFIERGIERTFYAYYNFRHAQQLHNGFSFDGKVMVFTKKYISLFTFPKNLSTMGNVDGYLYLWCKKNNYKYLHMPEVKVYFRLPQTVKDYYSWQKRSILSMKIWKKTYGKLVNIEYSLPKISISTKISEFLIDPMPVLVVAFINFIVNLNISVQKHKFITHWNLAKSTKKLKLQSVVKLVIS